MSRPINTPKTGSQQGRNCGQTLILDRQTPYTFPFKTLTSHSMNTHVHIHTRLESRKPLRPFLKFSVVHIWSATILSNTDTKHMDSSLSYVSIQKRKGTLVYDEICICHDHVCVSSFCYRTDIRQGLSDRRKRAEISGDVELTGVPLIYVGFSFLLLFPFHHYSAIICNFRFFLLRAFQ